MKTKVLLISEEILKSYTLISDQMDGKYLLPTIEMVQEIDLETLIGGALLKKLENLVDTGDIWNDENADYKSLLDNYIIPYMCWQVMAQIQPAINYKMANSGVYSNDDERKSRQDYKTNQLLQDQYVKNANSFATKMKNYLYSNIGKYPEYCKVVDFESAEDVPLCGIYLGDVPYRNRTYWYK